jgi:hypothetical protein
LADAVVAVAIPTIASTSGTACSIFIIILFPDHLSAPDALEISPSRRRPDG